MIDSLFAHLALKFSSHPENLATEALGYILRNSPGARAGVRDLLRGVGCTVPDDLDWLNQVGGDDGARPDLVGADGTGNQVLLVEAKFWAGLTDKQPVAYLDRLPLGGSLVVIGPARRETLLWGELRRRIVGAGRTLEERPSVGHHVCFTDGKVIALVSWRSVLTAARSRAQDGGEAAIAADVAQLEGLCERMDSEAYIPVTSEELSDHRFRRVLEFCDVVDAVAGRLVDLGVATTKGLRATGGKGVYVRYLNLKGSVGASLLCDVRKWMKFGATPLWLTVHGPTWRPNKDLDRLLAPLATETPRRMFMTGDGFPTVPIFVAPGQERHVVEQQAVAQIVAVAELLVGLASSPTADVAELPLPATE